MKRALQLLQPLNHWDTRLFLGINHRLAHRHAWHRLALWLSHSGSGPAYAAFGLLALWLDDAQGSRFALLLAWGYALERSLYWSLKNSIRRRRPGEAIVGWASRIVPSDRFSFPSGHTSGGFLFATAVLLCYPLFYPLALLWAIGIGGSRVVLGVHFPGDILAGAIMGAGCAWLVAGAIA